MSKSNLIEVINQAMCVSNGVAHHFKVQWAASEGRGHYVVAADALPEHGEPKTIHLMCRASILPKDLVKLLNDALEMPLLEGVVHGS